MHLLVQATTRELSTVLGNRILAEQVRSALDEIPPWPIQTPIIGLHYTRLWLVELPMPLFPS